ncbi:MAG: curli production assembly/transport component CsgF [Bacteroidota bacterium]
MDTKAFFVCLIALMAFALPSEVQAQDLVYRPINPAFGGETFNYQWLLNSANAQNLLEREDDQISSFNQNTSLDDFTESLNRQLLSQLSRQVVSNQFGEEGLSDGIYTVGNFQIDVATTIEGLSVTIVDTSVGERTEIVIPFF